MIQNILKGDTSGQVSLALADGYDYAGATVEVIYQGAVRKFGNCTAGQTIQFSFSADETAQMALGVFPVTVRIGKPDGTMITVANAGVKIAVTDCIGEVRAGSVIAVDVHGGLYGVDDLPANYTIKDLRAKINEIITKLGGGVAALCLLACTAFGASVTVQTAALEDIPNGAHVVTNASVDLSGLATQSYVLDQMTQSGSISPQAVTNITDAILASSNLCTVASADAKYRTKTDAPIAFEPQTSLTPKAISYIRQDANGTLQSVRWCNLDVYTTSQANEATTNIVTNVVTKTYVESLGISAGLKTNDVNGILASSNLCTVAAADAKYLPKAGSDEADISIKSITFSNDGGTLEGGLGQLNVSGSLQVGGGPSPVSLLIDEWQSLRNGWGGQTLPEWISSQAVTNGGAVAAATNAAAAQAAAKFALKSDVEENGVNSTIDVFDHVVNFYSSINLIASSSISIDDEGMGISDVTINNFGPEEKTISLRGTAAAVGATSNWVDGLIVHTNARFSNEVLKVQFGLGTNEVEQINALLSEAGETPIGAATTVGALLLALAAAVAALRKKKIDKLKCGTVEVTAGTTAGEADVSQLFTSANTSLVAVCREYGGTQIKQDENGNFYYEVEVED